MQTELVYENQKSESHIKKLVYKDSAICSFVWNHVNWNFEVFVIF